MSELHVCVISTGRAERVSLVEATVKNPTWYVPKFDVDNYRRAGARTVYGVAGTLPMKSLQLNTALAQSFIDPDCAAVATIDDDIVRCKRALTKEEVPIQQALEECAAALLSSKYYLGGPYSGGNTLWAPKEVRGYGLIPGAMMIHKRNARLAFDTTLPSMEDLDFCIQHHQTHGGVCLHGHFCLENLWENNAGGYQTCRNAESKRKTVELLHKKWSAVGCVFEFTEEKKNKIRFRIPWKKLFKGS